MNVRNKIKTIFDDTIFDDTTFDLTTISTIWFSTLRPFRQYDFWRYDLFDVMSFDVKTFDLMIVSTLYFRRYDFRRYDFRRSIPAPKNLLVYIFCIKKKSNIIKHGFNYFLNKKCWKWALITAYFKTLAVIKYFFYQSTLPW